MKFNKDTHVNMATLDRYFQAVILADAIASHNRPVAGAAAGGSSPKRLTAKKRRVARPRKHPKPSVQSSSTDIHVVNTRLMQSIVGERERASYCNEFIYLHWHFEILYVLVDLLKA